MDLRLGDISRPKIQKLDHEIDDPGTALEMEERKLWMEFFDASTCMRNIGTIQKEGYSTAFLGFKNWWRA